MLDGFGHVSVRDKADPKRFWMSRSMAPGLVTAEDLIAFDLDSKPLNARGRGVPLERFIHGAAYAARPDVMAVVHSHAPYATALSMLRRAIPASHYMIAAFGGARVECTDYAPFGTQELSDLALAGLGPRHGVLLGSHGMIAVGHDLERAMWLAGELETLARLHYLASLAGAPVLLPDEEVLRLVEKFNAYGPGSRVSGAQKN